MRFWICSLSRSRPPRKSVATAPGASVFYKDPQSGEIYHTYSTYGRGLDIFVTAYQLLDLVPKGRDEDDLPFDMAWVRHHDRYKEFGGQMTVIVKPGEGHFPLGPQDPTPVVDFIVAKTQ